MAGRYVTVRRCVPRRPLFWRGPRRTLPVKWGLAFPSSGRLRGGRGRPRWLRNRQASPAAGPQTERTGRPENRVPTDGEPPHVRARGWMDAKRARVCGHRPAIHVACEQLCSAERECCRAREDAGGDRAPSSQWRLRKHAIEHWETIGSVCPDRTGRLRYSSGSPAVRVGHSRGTREPARGRSRSPARADNRAGGIAPSARGVALRTADQSG